MRGFDVGTYNLVCNKRAADGKFEIVKEVNAFISLELENRFMFNMMKKNGVRVIERDKIAYVVGEDAVNIAYSMNLDLKRPMKDGAVNPSEKQSFSILSTMIHSLIGEIEQDGELLCYCVPAPSVNAEVDVDYHQKILKTIFDKYEMNGKKLNTFHISEGLALVYAELMDKRLTGIGISCLCPGTKIYTDKGIMPIEQVREGDLVLSHKGRWRPVNKVITKQFSGEMTKLQLTGYSDNSDEYRFVDNHELYVQRKGVWQWVGCEEVKEGDIVGEPIVNRDRAESQPTMCICERVTCSKEYTKKHVECSGNVQRLMGYFLGDGSISECEGCIQFDFRNDERDNIEDVAAILKQCFGKSSSETVHGDNCTRVKCYSKGLVSWFRNHCYDDFGKKYPWKLSKLNKTSVINLLAGLIRSDGHFTDESIVFTNTNTRLIMLVKQLFSRLGIPAFLGYREPRESVIDDRVVMGLKDEWTVSTGRRDASASLRSIIENIDCKHNRHPEKMFIEGGMCCTRVQKKEIEEYQGVVYDLQVEEDHSFSGPYLTIHNCGAGMVNVCVANMGVPVVNFSIVNSGDWIDKQAARVTGESATFINQEKTKVDLTRQPLSMVERAIQTQYRIMIEKTWNLIKDNMSGAGSKVRTDKPLDVILAGGTASPPGFDTLVKEVVADLSLPVEIGEIKRPKDHLYCVSRGCLLAAEASA